MLVVRTYLGPDSYGGTGLFADEDIAKGSIIWRFHDDFTEVYSLDDYKQAIAGNTPKAGILKRHAYPSRFIRNGQIVHAFLHDLDNGAYMNHSDAPSVGEIDAPAHPLYDERFNINVAMRDLKRGDELTNNYFSFDDNLALAHAAENCVSFLLKR